MQENRDRAAEVELKNRGKQEILDAISLFWTLNQVAK
jgi:hypothetical protein